MIFWLAVLAGALFAWIAVRIGFFAAWILFFHLVLAACVSIFLTPSVVAGVPAATSVYGYGYALTLASIAVATMFVGYGTCYACLGGRLEMPFPPFFDTIVAGFLGFLSGFFVWSFLVFVFFLMPVSQLDFLKRLGFDTQAQETNTSFICWWCDRLHWFIAPLADESTSRQAVEQLMAKATPAVETPPPAPPPPPPEAPSVTAPVATIAPEAAPGSGVRKDEHPNVTVQPQPLTMPTEHPAAEPAHQASPQPNATPSRPENSLTGTWMTPDGTQYTISEADNSLAISLASSDTVQSVRGKLIRHDGRSFAGTLIMVFSADLTRRYPVDVTLSITDRNHLHMTSSSWPSWDNAGLYKGKVTVEEVWSRGETNRANPFDP